MTLSDLHDRLPPWAHRLWDRMHALYFVRQGGDLAVAQRRAWVFSALGLDVFLVLLLGVYLQARALDLEAWFEVGFPSNMLVLRNKSQEALTGVVLRLDDQYVHENANIPGGLTGFDVSADFHDAEGLNPVDAYRPKTLLVSVGGRKLEFTLERKGH